MSAPWNPNDPDVVGPEFLPELNRAWTIGSTGGANAALTQRFRSTATELVEYATLFATAISGAGMHLLEIVEDGDEIPANVTTAMVAPNLASGVVNFINQAGSSVPANLIASIDETTDPSNLADHIGPLILGRPQSIDLEFATAALSLTGKRILGVAVGIRAMPHSSADKSDAYRVCLVMGGDEYGPVDRVVPSSQESWFQWGEIDPTGVSYGGGELPWFPTAIDPGFDDGTIQVRIAADGGDGIKFSRVRLCVIYADENRPAWAVLALMPGQNSNPLGLAAAGADADGIFGESTGYMDLYDPATGLGGSTGGGWAKADVTTYRACWRRAWLGDRRNDLAVTTNVMARYDDGLPDPDTYMDGPLVLVAGSVRIPPAPGIPVVAGAVFPAASRTPVGSAAEPVGIWSVRFRLASSGGDIADGQPYTQMWPATVDVDATFPVVSLLTTVAGGTYTAVRAVVGYLLRAPTADLTVEITNAAGTVVISTGTLTVAALQASARFQQAGTLCEVVVDMEPVVLAAATQYRVRFSSTTVAENPWTVGDLTTRAAAYPTTYLDTDQGAASYGGETDYALHLPGLSADPWDDLAAQFSLAIDGPTDLVTVTGSVLFDQAEPCPIDGVPATILTWTPSAAGADFARYQIQRRDDVTTEWEDVGYLTAESLEEFGDVEARLAIPSLWRLRTVGPLGQTSVWSDEVGLTLDPTGCGYTFSTNHDPLAAVGYRDSYDSNAERDYDFPDADEALVRIFAGRDEFVMFRNLDRRSVRFTRRLIVRAFRGGTGIVGPAAFDTLRTLVRDPALPYVCVRDEQGNRWYAGVLVQSGAVRQPGDLHRAAVEVIPVAVSPVPPTITA